MSRRRKLSEEERELWLKVAATARARKPESFEPEASPLPKKPRPEARAEARHELREFRLGQHATLARGHDLAQPIADQLRAAPVQMDRKTHQKMTRGRIDPEGKIDLHGMTMAEAHPELIRFILNSQDMGRRLVLVITGKGKMSHDDGPIPVRQGVLRHQVPHWLALPPLRPCVLQITPAHLKHGGTGAYYVYLRRR